MNDVRPITEVDAVRALIREHPERMRQEQATADTMIAAAAQLGRWDELERAVDIKIAEQQEFVTLWKERVRRPGQSNNAPAALILSVSEAQKRFGVGQPQVSRWHTQTAPDQVDGYRQRIIDAARVAAELKARANHRTAFTGNFEWYTPTEYVERARRVLGVIDLDPASSALAQETVRATRYFSEEDDGLGQEWHGRVWLNPPYNQPAIEQFIDKLVEETAAGRTTQAILLTHNSTDTAWFQKAARAASLTCFTCGRIAFVDTEGERDAPKQGQTFFYFGGNGDRFASEFADVGVIYPPVLPPPQTKGAEREVEEARSS